MAPSFPQMRALQIAGGLGLGFALILQFRDELSAWWWLLSLAVYFLTGCLGLTVTLHRALTHRAFVLPRPLEILFTVFAALGGAGSSIGWVATHRAHHAHSDTARDPHAPERMGLRALFCLYDHTFDPRHAKDLLRDGFHAYLHRHHTVLLLAWGLSLAVIGWQLCLFAFLIPAFALITILNASTIVTHRHGHRRFDTNDRSVNNVVFALLGWGEGWHNNHHAEPVAWNFSRRWWEIDAGGMVIAAMMATGLIARGSARRRPRVAASQVPAARPLF